MGEKRGRSGFGCEMSSLCLIPDGLIGIQGNQQIRWLAPVGIQASREPHETFVRPRETINRAPAATISDDGVGLHRRRGFQMKNIGCDWRKPSRSRKRSRSVRRASTSAMAASLRRSSAATA